MQPKVKPFLAIAFIAGWFVFKAVWVMSVGP
jgi:hypothetical protein